MSILEKTINLLNVLPESQIEIIYSFVQFLSSQQTVEKPSDTETLDEIFENIVGVVPDTGKTLEEYREERIRERYEAAMLPVVKPAAWIEMIGNTQNNR